MGVLVVGSSGGGTATLGHTDPVELLTTIHHELLRIRPTQKTCSPKYFDGIRYALFVSLHGGKSMDSVDHEKDLASLYSVDMDQSTAFQVKIVHTGLLSEVNKIVKEIESKVILPDIHSSSITGMICISCDPENTNFASLSAASSVRLPVTGSGGSSLSKAMAIHPNLQFVGNIGGSVATTTYTRAVSYTFSLAKAWNCEYSPTRIGLDYNATNKGGDFIQPRIRSVLDSCLPAFIATSFVCKILHLIGSDRSEFLMTSFTTDMLLWQMQNQVLPTICCVVATYSYSPQHKSNAIMAAAIASMSCHRSILAGLLAGRIVSWLLGRVLFICIRLGLPSTMTNISVAGLVGAFVAAMFSILKINYWFFLLSDAVRSSIQTFNAGYTLFGQIICLIPGIIFCYGSKVGWYHSIFLPLILIEMEMGLPSVLGAMDECTLVLVCAGICSGQLLFLSSKTDSTRKALCRRGLLINLVCGDFIEVAYPFMESSLCVNIFAYIASSLSTWILLKGNPGGTVMSTAYVPLPICIFISNNRSMMLLASSVAFFISFVGVCIDQLIRRTWTIKTKKYR